MTRRSGKQSNLQFNWGPVIVCMAILAAFFWMLSTLDQPPVTVVEAGWPTVTVQAGAAETLTVINTIPSLKAGDEVFIGQNSEGDWQIEGKAK